MIVLLINREILIIPKKKEKQEINFLIYFLLFFLPFYHMHFYRGNIMSVSLESSSNSLTMQEVQVVNTYTGQSSLNGIRRGCYVPQRIGWKEQSENGSFHYF
jgi:hypothetical protein